MNASKFLIAAAATVAVVGAIGIANSQSTPANSSGPITSPLTPDQTTPDSKTMPTHPAIENQRSNDSTVGSTSTPKSPVGDTMTNNSDLSNEGAAKSAADASSNANSASNVRMARADRN